jgi:hypothetical protein
VSRSEWGRFGWDRWRELDNKETVRNTDKLKQPTTPSRHPHHRSLALGANCEKNKNNAGLFVSNPVYR